MAINMHPAGDPSTRGWGPGWPHGQTNKMVPLTLPNATTFPNGVRREVATLMGLLLQETARRGYLAHKGWCWGYENRAITNFPDQPSLHSWGLAIDINAPANPYHSTLITDMPGWMPRLWAQFGFRWGGTYPGNKDAMHYEFMGTPSDASMMTVKAQALFVPLPPKPPVNPVTLVLKGEDMDPVLLNGSAGSYQVIQAGSGFILAPLDLATRDALLKQGYVQMARAASIARAKALGVTLP